MRNLIPKLLLLLPVVFGCGGSVGSPCTAASDCVSGYCYLPAQSDSGTCKENKVQSIP